jgi:hypothetical protein
MEPVTFTTDDGVHLEGELRLPDRSALASAAICHPHPRHGGSKDHPILWAIRNELAQRGLAVLAFNFRGVMGSGGAYGGGRDEVLDVRAAVGRVCEAAPDRPAIVCGWSFGANVAIREALDDDRVAALALIGLPVESHEVDVPALPSDAELRALRMPILLLAGERDGYSPAPSLRSLAERLPDANVEILADTDHYLWRREKAAAALVGAFVGNVLAG